MKTLTHNSWCGELALRAGWTSQVTSRSFLVCAGPGLGWCQGLAILFKTLGAIGYPCWEWIPLHSLLGRRGNQQCAAFILGIFDVLGKCWGQSLDFNVKWIHWNQWNYNLVKKFLFSPEVWLATVLLFSCILRVLGPVTASNKSRHTLKTRHGFLLSRLTVACLGKKSKVLFGKDSEEKSNVWPELGNWFIPL